MILKDSKGKELEISVYGLGDDMEIDGIEYLDGSEVLDNEVTYVLNKYGPQLELEAVERAMAAAEYYFEGDR